MAPSDILFRFINGIEGVIIAYFIVGNVTYTVLLLMSFVVVWLHRQRDVYGGLQSGLESPVTPPVTVIVPAFNEAGCIHMSIESLMKVRYPEKEIVIVDDGSTDGTLASLVERYGLTRVDFVYRQRLPAKAPVAFYYNPDLPMLTVVSKPNGGKPDALNVGINVARSPYFCTVDADCVVEPDALLRLMQPVIRSPEETVVSAGVVRILNGCRVEGGEVVQIRLPKRLIERFQVVEYLRSYLYGRPGWNLLRGTLIASGALCIFQREAAVEAGGFTEDTVTEDIEIMARLHRVMRVRGRPYRMVFSTDPVCWTVAPHNLKMLARQRRRWQLGLLQTIRKHRAILFNVRYGMLGMVSMPFHLLVEAAGAGVEFAGYLVIPVGFALGVTPFPVFVLFVMLATVYGAFLTIGGVLLEELNYRRYPERRDLVRLLFLAAVENFGYRQLMLWYRVQALGQFLRGQNRWEFVRHTQRVWDAGEPGSST